MLIFQNAKAQCIRINAWWCNQFRIELDSKFELRPKTLSHQQCERIWTEVRAVNRTEEAISISNETMNNWKVYSNNFGATGKCNNNQGFKTFSNYKNHQRTLMCNMSGWISHFVKCFFFLLFFACYAFSSPGTNIIINLKAMYLMMHPSFGAYHFSSDASFYGYMIWNTACITHYAIVTWNDITATMATTSKILNSQTGIQLERLNWLKQC